MKQAEFHDRTLTSLTRLDTKVEQIGLQVVAIDRKLEIQNGRVNKIEKSLAWFSGGAAAVGMLGASLWRWFAEGRR